MRMYMRCKCKKDDGVFLAKTHLTTGYFTSDNYYGDKTVVEAISDYGEKHLECHLEYDTNEMEIVYEFADDKEKER